MPEIRRGNTYLVTAITLAGLNLIMLAFSIVLVQQIVALREDTKDALTQIEAVRAETRTAARQTVLNQRAACERNNGLRSAVRFLITSQKEIADVVSGAATSPELRGYFRGIKGQYGPFLTRAGVQERNCVEDFPLP